MKRELKISRLKGMTFLYIILTKEDFVLEAFRDNLNDLTFYLKIEMVVSAGGVGACFSKERIYAIIMRPVSVLANLQKSFNPMTTKRDHRIQLFA